MRGKIHSGAENEKGAGYNKKNSKLITDKELQSLRKYSYALLKEAAGSLNSGRIEASPLKAGSGRLPCEYCDYRTVCGEYPPRRVRVYAKDAKKLSEEIRKF